MDSNSFTEATGRVLRILPKLYAGTVRMEYAQEHGMLRFDSMFAALLYMGKVGCQKHLYHLKQFRILNFVLHQYSPPFP